MKLKFAKYFILLFLFSTICSQIFAQTYSISNIYISGDKQTYPNVILKELTFEVGELLTLKELTKKINKSTENLNNTSLFNSVEITYTRDTITEMLHNYIYKVNSRSGSMQQEVVKKNRFYDTPDNIAKLSDTPELIDINIAVSERWYYWPHVEVVFEEKNMSTWIKKSELDRITLGLGVTTPNFLGLGHKLKIAGNFIFTKGFEFSYSNIALDRDRKHFIGIRGEYSKNKTIDCYTEGNKLNSISTNQRFLEKRYKMGLSYTYRKDIREKHTIYGEFSNQRINDTILTVNKDYWGSDKLSLNKLSFEYSYEYDQRNYQTYPTKGYYINAAATTEFALNDNFNYGMLFFNYKLYIALNSKWYFSTDLKASTSVKNRDAYIYDRAIGVGNSIMQSYELFVIDGQHYLTGNAAIKYLLLPRKDIFLRWFRRLNKFSNIHFTLYGKLFLDMGYAYNNNTMPNNCYANTLLGGVGAGLDLVTYYDIVLNAGYVINKTGNRSFVFGIKAPMF